MHYDMEKSMPEEKEMNSKKDLDKLVEIGYNELIKNGIGN